MPPPRPGSETLLTTGFEQGSSGVAVVNGGGGAMSWELPSRLAKRTGVFGLRVEVTRAYKPPHNAKVSLGTVWAVGGMEQLAVSFWARAESTAAGIPEPHVDVVDVNDKYRWLGHWR